MYTAQLHTNKGISLMVKQLNKETVDFHLWNVNHCTSTFA